jgi:hypothetical protein
MEKVHQMILLDADMRKVHARLALKFKAPLAQQEEHGIRTPETGVRGVNGAPESE